MKKKNVFIKAYTNCNLGDDLFIQTLVERYPSINFKLYAPSIYNKIFSSYSNLNIITADSLIIRIIEYIFRKLKISKSIVCDMILITSKINVFIGGSIFIQPKVSKRFLIDQRKIISNKHNYIIGSNFGPFDDTNFLLWNRDYFKKFKDICFRDKYSYKLFEDLSNIRYANDVIFAFRDTMEIKDEKCVFISVIDFKIRNNLRHLQLDYKEKMVEIINRFVDEGFKIKLSSFCKSEGDEDMVNLILQDENLAEDVVNNITTVLYNGNINEIIKHLKSSEFIIASRFHAMILGLLLNKKTFPIIYSDKMKNVIFDNHWDMEFAEVKNINSLIVDELMIYFKESKIINIEDCIKNAENQFASLDKLLNNTN